MEIFDTNAPITKLKANEKIARIVRERCLRQLDAIVKEIDNNREIKGLKKPWGVSPAERKPVYNNGKLLRTQKEVDAYYLALDYILNSGLDLTEGVIKEIHSRTMSFGADQGRGGVYKTIGNDMKIRNTDGPGGVLVKTSAPANTSAEMKNLINWCNTELKLRNTHPLYTISLFIYQFLVIHPFADGNGRTSRALINLLLLKTGYKFIQFAPLEGQIEYYKYYYFKALLDEHMTAKGGGDITGHWTHFFLTTLQLLIKGIKEPSILEF